MSDGREEREEQEQRRKWEMERKDREEDRDRDWERDGEAERRDSRAADVAALDAGSLDDELVARFQQGVRRAGLDLGGVGDVKRVNIVVIGRDEFGIGDRVGRREKPGPADGDAIHSLGLSMLSLG